MSGQMIAAHEGQEIHSSWIDAIVAQEIQRQNDARVAEAQAARKAAEDDAQLMRRAYSKFWTERIADANVRYSHNPAHGRAAMVMAGVIGLVVLVIATGWRTLMRALGM